MIATPKQADRVLLYNMSWQQWEDLLEGLGETRSARVAYDRGTVEIMSPLPEHEYYKEALGLAVLDIAEELDMNYASFGSTTWRREAKQAGLEPDNSYYFQHEPDIRGRVDLRLDRDPPPDLALEIDLTHKSLNRFEIYARLGVPELWCYEADSLTVYQLQESGYLESQHSSVFPGLEIQALPRLMEEHRSRGQRAIRKAVRAWVRSQR
ncbi:Uma2 family endonuclease [Synechococcus sp. PCC 7336]|uniref:Uma2 family endonuclease n=1 Tax=Synechococcus sp. PCC 7336 TaxID=195250 RepID=UPI0003476EE4|nr:Uma2 family endonuclease [Synechococcus sp. PCC 7336]